MFGLCFTTGNAKLNSPKEEGWTTVKEITDPDRNYSYAAYALLGGDGFDTANLVEVRDYNSNPVTDRRYKKAELAQEGLSRLTDAGNAYLDASFNQRIITYQEHRQLNQAICSVERRATLMSTNFSKSASAYQAASHLDSPLIMTPHTVKDSYFLFWHTCTWRSYPDGNPMYARTTYR